MSSNSTPLPRKTVRPNNFNLKLCARDYFMQILVLIGTVGASHHIHCVSKKHPDVFSYNSRKHRRIFIIFGRNIAKKASNHTML